MAILSTGNTYVTNDQVTAANLNAAINSATFASGAVDGATTQLSGGAVIVKDKGITASKLESGSNGQLFIGNGTGFTKATLTAGSNITITNASGGITIAAASGGGGGGSVTSVDVSGGTTGLTSSGGPITTSGTITLAGTLAVANGGTGATSAGAALSALGAYAASNPSGFTSNTGTVTSVGVSGADGIGVASSPVTTSGTIALTLGSITPDDVTSTGFVQGSEYRVSGTKVLGAQQAAEGDVTTSGSYIGSDTTDNNAIQSDISAVANKLNALLAKLRTHGIIAT